MICKFTEFKPARLFAMTGMSTDLQQLWRRRGQLPWGDGEPRPITALEAAEMFLRHQLALVGVPPSESAEIGRENAPIVVWHALLNVDGACVVRGAPDKVAAFLAEFESSHSLATELTGVTDKDAFRYLYRFNGSGDFLRSHDYPTLVDHEPFSTVMAINLNGIGTMLAQRAETPLIAVDLPDHRTPRSEWITRST